MSQKKSWLTLPVASIIVGCLWMASNLYIMFRTTGRVIPKHTTFAALCVIVGIYQYYKSDPKAEIDTAEEKILGLLKNDDGVKNFVSDKRNPLNSKLPKNTKTPQFKGDPT